MRTVFATRPVSLPYGWASTVVSGDALIMVAWEKSVEILSAMLTRRFPGFAWRASEWGDAGKFLAAYARGRRMTVRECNALPLDWDRARGFDRNVLRETANIPYGRVETYGSLAVLCGSAGAARAVGAALSRNPWPIVVPCHRVVGAGGRLVGFGKGLAAKESLLAFETVSLGADQMPNKKAN